MNNFVGWPLKNFQFDVRTSVFFRIPCMKPVFPPLTAVLLALFTSLVLPVRAEPSADWAQWRGPTRDGMVVEQAWPEKLAGRLKKVWRVELDKSYASPVILGDRVFTVETRDKKEEVVRALDRETGKELWHASWKGSMRVPFFAASNGSWVRSTPATDGERLFVAGMRDVLVCLDVQSGKELWRVNFVEQLKTPLPSFGFVCSPLLAGDHVYVQAGSGFVKLHKRSGKILWRSLKDVGGMWGSAFSSPVLAKLAGREQFVVLTRQKLAGVTPDDGEVLWEQPVKAFRGMNILTPTVVSNSLFTAAYGGSAWRFDLAADADEGAALRIESNWNAKLQGYMSSPIYLNGHVYLHMRNERLACIDFATGEKTWTSDKGLGKYLSMICNGEQMLCLNERGVLHLIEATPEKYNLIDTLDISEQETWAHLTLVGNSIFVRELKAMSRFDWE